MTNGTPNLMDKISKPSISDVLFWSGLFVAMILGMLAKTVHDNLEAGIRMDSILQTDVLLPVLVSPIVFGGIYGMIRETPRNVGTFIFAFQNGFFWKAIFGQATPSIQ